MTIQDKLHDTVKKELTEHKDILDALHRARNLTRINKKELITNFKLSKEDFNADLKSLSGQITLNVPEEFISVPNKFVLVAQGDSWFDYPGDDIINYLRDSHGHFIDNMAIAGATLNDIVYGLMPEHWGGIFGSNKVHRITQLIDNMTRVHAEHEKLGPLRGVLLSGGGNDIAGPEFFSFLNNKDAITRNPNAKVVEGVVTETFKSAYTHMINVIHDKAEEIGLNNLQIFIQGYDYPWPDGRGFTLFNVVGPWFHEAFNQKNYFLDDKNGLNVRREIVKGFIKSFNDMIASIAKDYPYVHHVDLQGVLGEDYDLWANELHPTSDGFKILASKFDSYLQSILSTKIITLSE